MAKRPNTEQNRVNSNSQSTFGQKNEQLEKQNVQTALQENERILEEVLGSSYDFVIRRFTVFDQHAAFLVYLSNMVEIEGLNEDVLRPLFATRQLGSVTSPEQVMHALQYQVLYHANCQLDTGMLRIVHEILQGKCAVFVDGMQEAFLIGVRQVQRRAVEQPPTEQVIQGPREGFIESLDRNIGLIRYRVQTPDFQTDIIHVGKITKSKVAVCYIQGIANDELIKEVKQRLSEIDIDAVLDVGYLEQLIEDHPYSPFPQVQNTERPDKAVANMVEGRVTILMDGSPFALIVPTVFSQFYQTAEDYSSRFLQASFVRLARVVALVFSLVFPSLYVAILSYNPELIPTQFAVAVAGGRAGVPFPSFVEVLIMEVSMEVLREATIRLPQQVGGALSIVGVLVIGQAAVSAGFASPITVVVIALTTIGSFATPAYNAAFALRMLRFPMIALAGMFGLYGVMIGLIIIANHVLSLKSFGVSYMSPASPGNFQGMKDLVFRLPFWSMKYRPSILHASNYKRTSNTGTQMKHSHHHTLDPMKMKNQNEGAADEYPEATDDHTDGSHSN